MTKKKNKQSMKIKFTRVLKACKEFFNSCKEAARYSRHSTKKTKSSQQKRLAYASNSLRSTLKRIKFRIALYWSIVENIFLYIIIPQIKIRSKTIISLAYFFVLIVIAYIIGILLNGKTLTLDTGTFYTSAGAMVGGMLAIVFSLGIILTSTAAERIPVGFYRVAARDLVGDLMLIILSLICVILFVFAVLSGNLHIGYSQLAIQITIVLIGIVLLLVMHYYSRIKDRLNPENVLKLCVSQSLDIIHRAEKRAGSYVKVAKQMPGYDTSISDNFLLSSIYQRFDPDFELLNQRIRLLFDYHDKLVVARERSSGANIIRNILLIYKKYFWLRKDSSVIVLSGLMGTASDSERFLSRGIERLLATGLDYLRNQDDAGITQIIETFVELCTSAAEIVYVQNIRSENPIFFQCRSYFDSLVKEIIRFQSFEGSYQAAVAYGRIGNLATKNNLHLEFGSIYKQLDSIIVFALTNDHKIVASAAFTSYTQMIIGIAYADNISTEMEIKHLLQSLQQMILISFRMCKLGTLDNNYFMTDTLSLPFDKIHEILFDLAEKVSGEQDDEKKNAYVNDFLVIAEELRSALRYLSENMGTADHFLLHNLGNIISDIGCLLIALIYDSKWSTESVEINRLSSWYLHQPAWFTYKVEKIEPNQSYESLSDAVVRMGFVAMEKSNDELSTASINQSYSFVTDLFEKQKSESLFSLPRIMLKVCLLGIYALKLGKEELFLLTKNYALKFDEKWVEKYFSDAPVGVNLSPDRDQLLEETLRIYKSSLRSVHDRLGGFRNDPEEYILNLVEAEDIKKYIEQVWDPPQESFETSYSSFF